MEERSEKHQFTHRQPPKTQSCHTQGSTELCIISLAAGNPGWLFHIISYRSILFFLLINLFIVIHTRLRKDNTPESAFLTYFMINNKGYNTEEYCMWVYIIKFHFDRRTRLI